MFEKLRQRLRPEPVIVPPPPSGDSISRTLDSLRPLDYLFEPNIGQLQQAYEDAPDKADCLTRYVKFFVERPTKLRLLDTPYFSHKHAGETVFDLIIAAGRYGQGRLDEGQAAIAPHAQNARTPFFPMLLARFQMARGDTAGELATIKGMLNSFPKDPKVVLYQLAYERRVGNFEEANRLLDQVRDVVEKFLAEEIQATQKSANDLVEAIAEQRLVRTGDFDIYSDDLTRQTWYGYYERYITHNRLQSRDGFLIQKLDEDITQAILAGGVDVVLDFGSLCAEIIARPALKVPTTHFVGIDRQEFVATLNEEAYSIPNMEFESGDIFDYLPKLKSAEGTKMLFHARTTTLLYPELVRRIYQASADAGVEYIMGWEPNGLSRKKLRFFDFDDMPEVSVPHKGVMISHNYKQLLADAGYEITRVQHIPSMVLCPTIDDLVWTSLLFEARRKR